MRSPSLPVVLATLLGVSFLALALLVSAESPQPDPGRDVSLVQRGSRAPVVAIFVDSLSREVAESAAVMPGLVELAARGAHMDVEPCRDRITYLCLRAVLTGRDESNFLAFHRNFAANGKPLMDSSLLRLREAGRTIQAVGAEDFRAYAVAFERSELFAAEATPARDVLAAWERVAARALPDLTLVGFSASDRVAHVARPGHPDYLATFREIDAAIKGVVAGLPSDAHVIVFGDHGHDELGRHLPGSSSPTVAILSGPAFRAGARGHMLITDHRVLWGILLGIPTPAVYQGSPLTDVLAPAWLAERYAAALPELRGTPLPGLPRLARLALALLVALALVLVSGALSRAVLGRVVPAAATALVRGGLALASMFLALTGLFYSEVRGALHDQGYTPERNLYLIIPFLGPFVVVHYWHKKRGRPEFDSWLERSAWFVVAITMFCLFPAPNYYGAGRALVFAALIGLGVVLLRELVRCRRERRPVSWPWLAQAFIGLAVFGTYYDVRGIGGEGGQMVSYVMRAALYADHPWLALSLSKVLLFALLHWASRSARLRASAEAPLPVDALLSALLLVGLLFVQLSEFDLPPPLYLAFGAGAVLTPRRIERALPSTASVLAFVPLDHFYQGELIHLAPLEMLLAGTLAVLLVFERMNLAPAAKSATVGLVLASSAYLLLWPTLGFRLSGIDFSFMFSWVAAEDYLRFWWVIALGTVLKFLWPYLLLVQLARRARAVPGEIHAAGALLCLKALLLGLFAAWYSLRHAMSSNEAMGILSEHALVIAGSLALLLSGAVVFGRRQVPVRSTAEQLAAVP